MPVGQVVALQVNADPSWHARQDGHPIAIFPDMLGFMVLHPAPAGNTRLELRYGGTAEQRLMAAVSAIAWIAAFSAVIFPPLKIFKLLMRKIREETH